MSRRADCSGISGTSVPLVVCKEPADARATKPDEGNGPHLGSGSVAA